MKKRKPVDDDNGFAEFGGYMDAKISKLEEQFASDTVRNNTHKKSDLFTGISIFVNGYTKPSANELKRLMMTHGGVYHHYHRSGTKYIIASNLPDVKIRSITTAKIIKPDWVVDCIKENRILDYSKYLLYTNQKVSQPTLQFPKKIEEMCNSNDGQFHLFDASEESSVVLDKTEASVNQATLATSSDQILEDVKNETTKSTRTAVDPKFLSEFYNNSRLHHISTLGAAFKQHINSLRENHDGNFPSRVNLPADDNFEKYNKLLMHIDMDCFFVSVGLRSRPNLRGLPVAVTHSKGTEGGMITPRDGVDRQSEVKLHKKRLQEKLHSTDANSEPHTFFETVDDNNSMSEIASCSYEARKIGVKNGMFVGAALKLCPNLKTIPYDFNGYKEVAYHLYNTVAQYTLDIEAVSCDEMFVDLTSLLNECRVIAEDFVGALRTEVKAKTGCPCSAGIGENRLLARMATKKAKPEGQYFLKTDYVSEFIKDIPIADLPGVGYTTNHRLEQCGWRVCGDLNSVSMTTLQKELGKKLGDNLFKYARGIDDRSLVFGQIRKSVSAEVNYGIRFKDNAEVETFLRQLCGEVHNRLTEINRTGKCITLKLMVRAKDAPVETSKFMGHGICDSISKSITLASNTADLDVIIKSILSIMKALGTAPNELRGIGIQITKLNTPNDESNKTNSLITMFDKVKQRNETMISKDSYKTLAIERVETITQEPNTSTHKKTRGRPPKSSTITSKSETSGTLPNMFRNAPKIVTDIAVDFSDLDQEVLAALPEDIRQEVLRDHKRQKQLLQMKTQKQNKVADSNIDPTFLDALPLHLRQEIENEMTQKSTKFQEQQLEDVEIVSLNDAEESAPSGQNMDAPIIRNDNSEDETVDNIFLKPNWRFLLNSWIQSTSQPLNTDVEILSTHARDLFDLKKWDDLYIKLRYLHRIINEHRNCNWHQVYFQIVTVVQNVFFMHKSATLKVETEFECNNCKYS